MSVIYYLIRCYNNNIVIIQNKNIMSIYPKGNLRIYQSKTQSGLFSTGWQDGSYDNFAQKKSFPLKILLKVNLIDYSDNEIGIDEIEELFDKKMKSIGVSHFIKRYTTDLGLDMIFYCENKNEFESELIEFKDNNELNINFEFIIYDDPKWRTLNYRTEAMQSIDDIKSIINKIPKELKQWKESGLNINEKFEVLISFYSSDKFEAKSFVRALEAKGIKVTIKMTRTIIILKGYIITVFKEGLWDEDSLETFISKIAFLGNAYLCRLENIKARVEIK